MMKKIFTVSASVTLPEKLPRKKNAGLPATVNIEINRNITVNIFFIITNYLKLCCKYTKCNDVAKKIIMKSEIKKPAR